MMHKGDIIPPSIVKQPDTIIKGNIKNMKITFPMFSGINVDILNKIKIIKIIKVITIFLQSGFRNCLIFIH